MKEQLEIKFEQAGKSNFLTFKDNQEASQIVAELERAGARGIIIEPAQPRFPKINSILLRILVPAFWVAVIHFEKITKIKLS